MPDPLPAPYSGWSHRLAAAGLLLLGALMLVGTSPFEADGPRMTGLQNESSLLEAVLYLAASLMCLAAALPRLLKAPGTVLPWSIVLLLGYCWVSLFWSHVPAIGAVRLLQTMLVTLGVLASVAVLGTGRATALLVRLLALIVCVDLASVLLVDNARDLDGAWKGLHSHKNTAGPVAAIALCSAAACFAVHRRGRFLLLAMASALLLVGTQSKTSILLVAPVILCCAAYGWSRPRLGAAGVYLLAGALALGLLLVGLGLQSEISALLEDPKALTGRAELWHALSDYAASRWWSGSGFGSFWRLGYDSPIFGLTEGWGLTTGQAHNGYLEALIGLGWPGAALTVLALLLLPLARLVRIPGPIGIPTGVALAILLFAALHNLAESSLLAGGHPMYFFLLLALATGHQAHRRARLAGAFRLPAYHWWRDLGSGARA